MIFSGLVKCQENYRFNEKKNSLDKPVPLTIEYDKTVMRHIFHALYLRVIFNNVLSHKFKSFLELNLSQGHLWL